MKIGRYILALTLAAGADTYAQSPQPQREIIYKYQNGRLIILPRPAPVQTTTLKRQGNDILKSYTDRRQGTTTNTNESENLRRYLADKERRAQQILQELRSKGYIR